MTTAEVKLGGSQLLVKHTAKLWLRDEKKKRMQFLINKNGFYYQQKLRKGTSKDHTSGRRKASPTGKSGRRVARTGDE